MAQLIASSVVLAGLYAIIAIGFVLIYRASRLLNFAHGEMMMVGAYFAYTIAVLTGGQAIYAVVGAVILSFVSGAILYYLLMRPMLGQPVYAGVVATIGLSILVRGAATLFWTPAQRYLDEALRVKVTVYRLPMDVVLSQVDIVTIITAVIIVGGTIRFLRGTSLGIRMLASADEPVLAAQRGIDINLMFALAWSIATLCATLAGVLYGAGRALNPDMGYVGLAAFPAAVVGGMTSLGGVLPGALLIALMETFAMRYADAQTAAVLPMIVLLLVLIVRPWGLFGRPEEIERV